MLALTLTACGASAPSIDVSIGLPPLPNSLLSVSCSPTTLPAGPLTKAQVEKLWARDRARLVKCGYTVGGLIAFYIDLSKRLAAAGTRK